MRTGTIAALAAVFTLALAGTAQAVSFNPEPGAYTANTTTLSLTGPGTSVTGAVVGGVAVFSFDEVNIPEGATLTVTGLRPFKMVASGAMTVSGEINGSGVSANNLTPGPYAGGPGGGAGGKDDTESGQGFGGGTVASTESHGGGGGGFGGFGAAGGLRSGFPGFAGEGGVPYSDITVALEGGSGGAGASAGDGAVGGGGGGGAVALYASSVSIPSSGRVLAAGGGGAVGGFGASGGGSGGGIFLHAGRIEVRGTLNAAGGPGGAGGCCGDGGGGGGGEIAYQYQTLAFSGSASVNGGTSGTRSSGLPLGHGGLSPEPEGEAGFIVEQQGAGATSAPATGVTTSGATINGSVNPHGNATTYRFEYGTSTSYGSAAPSTGGPAGSGTSAVNLSQTLTGLAANTTYHYRIVSTDSLGFTAVGNDVSFTTAAVPPPPPKAPDTKITKAKINKKSGKATFKFKATGTATGFQCSLAKKGKKAKFKKCKSPKTYKGLKAGKYTFQVKAVNGSAADPTPAKRKFKIS